MVKLKTSVVMPIKDRFDLAEIALLSVVNQTMRADQIVLVDDASFTPVETALKRVIQEAQHLGIQVSVLRNSVSLGASAARNAGAKHASGDILLFCDSDDFWVPHKISLVQEIMSARSELRLLVHSFYWIGGRLAINMFIPFGKLICLPRWVLYGFGCLTPSCVCLRSQIYGSGFDEDIKYHEDLEFALRLAQKEKIWFLSYPLASFGRPPFTQGGMTSNIKDFRKGAIDALHRHPSQGFSYFLGRIKIFYHKWKISRIRQF